MGREPCCILFTSVSAPASAVSEATPRGGVSTLQLGAQDPTQLTCRITVDGTPRASGLSPNSQSSWWGQHGHSAVTSAALLAFRGAVLPAGPELAFGKLPPGGPQLWPTPLGAPGHDPSLHLWELLVREAWPPARRTGPAAAGETLTRWC